MSGVWTRTISPIAARIGGASALSRRRALSGDRAGALVDLEQQRGSRGRPDSGVRLDQLALTTVERVLGPVEIAHLYLSPALAQERPLLRIERVAPTDLRRVVRVEDAPLRRPDLRTHDRPVENTSDHDVVDCCQGGRLARDQALGHALLHELARLLHPRPRLALRLFDRD